MALKIDTWKESLVEPVTQLFSPVRCDALNQAHLNKCCSFIKTQWSIRLSGLSFIFYFSCGEVREEAVEKSNYLRSSQGPSGCLSLCIFLTIMSSNQNEWLLLGGLGPARTDAHLAVRQLSLCCHSDQSNAAAPLHPCGERVLQWWLGMERPWQVLPVVLLRGLQCWTHLCIIHPRAGFQFKLQ